MSRALVELRGPIWNGGKPHIGVADFRIGPNDEVEVKITYKRKDGTESYPGTYIMKAAELKKYPTQVVGSGVTLYVAPLRDWKHVLPPKPSIGLPEASPSGAVKEDEPVDVNPKQERLL